MKLLKKLIPIIVSMMICVSMVSCGKEEKDTVAPEILGVKILNAVIFENCNLFDGITVKDDTDGDITYRLSVAVLPFADVNNGIFRPVSVGEYQVVYKAEDKSGNEVKAYSKVIVSGDDNRKLFKAYDFYGSDLGASDIECYNKTEDGAIGKAEFKDGKLVYSIEKFGNIDWYNKLTLVNLFLTPGKKYSVEFKAKSTNALTFAMFVNINGGAWNPVVSSFVSLTTDFKLYSFETNKLSINGNYAMFLQFGSADNQALSFTEIVFDYVRIYEVE